MTWSTCRSGRKPPLLTGNCPKIRLSPCVAANGDGIRISCCLAVEDAAMAFITVRISRGPYHGIRAARSMPCYSPNKSAVATGRKVRGDKWVNRKTRLHRSAAGYQLSSESYRYLRMGIVGLLVAIRRGRDLSALWGALRAWLLSAYPYSQPGLCLSEVSSASVHHIALRGINLPKILPQRRWRIRLPGRVVPILGGSAACQDPDVRVTNSVQGQRHRPLIVGGVAIAGEIIILAEAGKCPARPSPMGTRGGDRRPGALDRHPDRSPVATSAGPWATSTSSPPSPSPGALSP